MSAEDPNVPRPSVTERVFIFRRSREPREKLLHQGRLFRHDRMQVFWHVHDAEAYGNLSLGAVGSGRGPATFGRRPGPRRGARARRRRRRSRRRRRRTTGTGGRPGDNGRQMMKRSESTALAATAKNWTPTARRATNPSSTPALGVRPEGSRRLPRAFALFGDGAAVLSRGGERGQFSTGLTRSRFMRIYESADTSRPSPRRAGRRRAPRRAARRTRSDRRDAWRGTSGSGP